MRLSTVRALAGKDLRIFFSDRRAVFMSFAAPIAIASFFGFLFSGAGTRENAPVPVVVVDQDDTAVSRAIVAGLGSEPALAVRAASVEQAREQVRKGEVAVAVVVPPGFAREAGRALFGAGPPPSLPLLFDPSRTGERAMVGGMVTQYVMQAVSAEMFSGEQGRAFARDTLARLDAADAAPGLPAADRDALRGLLESTLQLSQSSASAGAGVGQGFRLPFEAREEAVTAGSGIEYNAYAHSFAGMGVQFLLFACLDLAILMLTEREHGIWRRLRAAPLSRAELLAARGASSTLVALLVLAVTFAFGMVVFGIRIEGSVVGFVAVCVATAVMAATFGLLVAALGRTPGGTRGIAILAVLIMVMLGGAWVPAFIFPAWLQTLTLVVPARWAVDGLDATTWRGADLAAAMLPAGALLAFAVLFAALATLSFRWESR